MVNSKNKKDINILVIDDDDRILKSIEKQLKDETFNVEFTNDPLVGLDKIEENKYDLVISDIKMKSILGTDVLRVIKTKYSDMPVIILTGYVDDSIMEEARFLGCNDFLIKPVRKSELLESINKILKN